MIDLSIDEFFTKDSTLSGVLHLDETTDNSTSTESSPDSKTGDDNFLWSHFITLAFPQNHKFAIKHNEYMANGNVKISMEPIKYRDCSTFEQYLWIQWIFNKFLNRTIKKYDFFFEHCLNGDLHLHGRITLWDETKHIKDIKIIFHRMFGLSVKFKNFCDVQVYNKDKWNDYQNKYSERKKHQTSTYKNYTNI